MAANFATLDDVEEMIGEVDDDETAKVNGLLRRASTMIRSQVATIDLRIAQGLLDPQTAEDICADMVVRVLRNEDGIKQETIGPTAVTYDPTVASGKLFMTPEELFLLYPPKTIRSPVGTIRTVPGLGPREMRRRRDGLGEIPRRRFL